MVGREKTVAFRCRAEEVQLARRHRDVRQIASRIELILCGFRTIKSLPPHRRVVVGGRFSAVAFIRSPATTQRFPSTGHPITRREGRGGEGVRRCAPREDPLSYIYPRHPMRAQSMVDALSKYWRRSDRAVHCAPSLPFFHPVSCLGLTFSKAARRGRGTRRVRNFPRIFLRDRSLTHTHTSRSAVSRYVSPTAMRSRRHVTSLSRRRSSLARGSSMRDLTAPVTRDTVVRSR